MRARIQQIISDETGKFDLSQLIGKKTEIMKAVREDVQSFFKTRGIAISTISGYHCEDGRQEVNEGLRGTALFSP